jgi:heat-inducible transcriptional repressor
MDLDTRKRLVLQAVVEDYVQSAEPVGSRTLARKHALGVSPATIRIEMADLEEMGYLEQPHTSAGRIPSDKGYRFYVDQLLGQTSLDPWLAERVHQALDRRARGVVWLVQQTARLLSSITNYACLAVGPNDAGARLVRLSLLPVEPGRTLLVVLTDQGLVHHRLLDVPPDMDEAELDAAVAVLTRRLAGQPLASLEYGLLEEITRDVTARQAFLDQIFSFLLEELPAVGEEEGRVFVTGAARVAEQPEFRDVERLRTLVAILEEERLVQELLTEGWDDDDGIGVVIGEEHQLSLARDLALVVTAVPIGHGAKARFGVLGPKRMDYGRVLALLGEVHRTLAEAIG